MRDPFERLLPNSFFNLDKRYMRLKSRIWKKVVHTVYEYARGQGYIDFIPIAVTNHAQFQYTRRFGGKFWYVLVDVMHQNQDAVYWDSKHESFLLYFEDEELVIPFADENGVRTITTCYSKSKKVLDNSSRWTYIDSSEPLSLKESEYKLDDE